MNENKNKKDARRTGSLSGEENSPQTIVRTRGRGKKTPSKPTAVINNGPPVNKMKQLLTDAVTSQPQMGPGEQELIEQNASLREQLEDNDRYLKTLQDQVSKLITKVLSLESQLAHKDNEIAELEQKQQGVDIDAFTNSKWAKFVDQFRECIRNPSILLLPTIAATKEEYDRLKSDIPRLQNEIKQLKSGRRESMRLSERRAWRDFYMCVKNCSDIKYSELSRVEQSWYLAGQNLEKLSKLMSPSVFEVKISLRFLTHNAHNWTTLENWIKQMQNPATPILLESESE